MKRVLIVITGVLILIGNTYAHSFNGVFHAKDLKVRTSTSQSPLVVGENDVAIELLNADGSAIKDAEVSVYFFMPSMPAMNYEVSTTVKGDRYAAVIKPTMPGKWAADIKVKKSGGAESKVQVDFEVK